MDDVDGGPGWILDGVTLLPRIVDLAAFRRGLADDPLGDAVEHLWSGRLDDAEALLHGHEPTLRVRALLADCYRARGNVVQAMQEYSALVAECAGTPWEAVMRQHLGKALFTAGEFTQAAEQFARALTLRQEAGAGDDLLASSRQALEAARRDPH